MRIVSQWGARPTASVRPALLFPSRDAIDRRYRLLSKGRADPFFEFQGGAAMPRFPQRFVLSGLACALVVAVGLVAWALATGSSQAQSGTMHNCPPPGQWAISVWDGSDGTDTGQALATCGDVAVAYWLDPQTRGWLWYSPERVGMSNLLTLSNGQGIIALGGATGAAGLGAAGAASAPQSGSMLNCPPAGN